MRIKQHLMTLGWIGANHEGATGAEFGMSRENLAVDATDDQPFFTPVKLKGKHPPSTHLPFS